MLLTFRLLGVDIFEVEAHHDEPADDDSRLTFGFASCTGSSEISDDRALDFTDG